MSCTPAHPFARPIRLPACLSPPCSDRVLRALKLCARDAFVPPAHRDEALIDAPIRVEEHDFNISAPHMHATCLEALQLQPGHKVRAMPGSEGGAYGR